jgi:hypothetical protein
VAELVATALWEIGGAVLTDAAVFIAANATAVNAVALVSASMIQADRQRKKAIARYNAGLQDRLVMTATANGPRSRCYGRVRNVDGVLFKATRGDNKEFYTLFIAVAGHQIDGFETVYFGDKAVTLDGNGYVQTEPYLRSDKTTHAQATTLDGSGNGSVTAGGTVIAGSASAAYSVGGDSGDTAVTASSSGAVISLSGGPPGQSVTVTWQQADSGSRARVRFYDGSPGQDVSAVLAPLFPGLITSGQHRFAGIAGMLVDLEFDPEAYPGGVPSISAVFRGARVYDPRSGLTVWTQNPALHARDWALYPYGGGCASADLNEPSFTAAANACDISQPFTTPSGTTSLPLFTGGTVFRLGEDAWEQFDELVEAMAGKRGWAGGQLRVMAGVYRAPVATITESWLGGQDQVQIVPEPPADEAVNVYRPTISDKDQDYVAVPAPEVRASGYISADGRELPREITLGAVTDNVHAQHICGVLMRDARNGLTVVLPCNLRAYQLELFDVVAVTLPRFGWTAKEFEVLGWRFGLSGGVVLTLKETAASIYQPDALFSAVDATPNTGLPDPSSVPDVGPLTVTSGTAGLQDGSVITRTRVQWPAIADQSVTSTGGVEVQYALLTGGLVAGAWVSAPPESGGAVETVISGLKLGFAYAIRARAINALGLRGEWSKQVLHIVAGKRRGQVFRQTTAPAGADLVDGDQWFDTDDNNRHYVRSSGAWVDVRDGGISVAQAAAAAAQATATTAASNASLALAELDDIAADSVLTPGEKPRLIQDRDVIVAEQSGIVAQADNYLVATEKTNYQNAVTALVAHLGGLTLPVAWDNLTGNTTITGPVFRAKFADVYTTRQALLDKISANAKARLGALATLSTVDTAQLSTSAATVVFTPATAATTTVGIPAGTWADNTKWMTVACSHTWTNDGATSVTVQAETLFTGSMVLAGTSGSFLTGGELVFKLDGVEQTAATLFRTAGLGSELSWALFGQVAVPAGAVLVVELRGMIKVANGGASITQAASPSSTLSVTNSLLRSTIIKR